MNYINRIPNLDTGFFDWGGGVMPQEKNGVSMFTFILVNS